MNRRWMTYRVDNRVSDVISMSGYYRSLTSFRLTDQSHQWVNRANSVGTLSDSEGRRLKGSQIVAECHLSRSWSHRNSRRIEEIIVIRRQREGHWRRRWPHPRRDATASWRERRLLGERVTTASSGRATERRCAIGALPIAAHAPTCVPRHANVRNRGPRVRESVPLVATLKRRKRSRSRDRVTRAFLWNGDCNDYEGRKRWNTSVLTTARRRKSHFQWGKRQSTCFRW